MLISGHYMYIESSAPRVQGDKARLTTPQLPPTNNKCLTFWYHMYGSDIGTLNVYVSTYNKLASPLITLQGDKGNKWKIAQTTIQSQSNYKVFLHISCYILNTSSVPPISDDPLFNVNLLKKIVQ